jgi:hypothetical protein
LNRFLLFLLLFLFTAVSITAQTIPDTGRAPVKDTLTGKDTTRTNDTLSLMPAADTTRYKILIDPAFQLPVNLSAFITRSLQLIKRPPGFVFKTATETGQLPDRARNFVGKELLFYALVLLFIFFAVLRRVFPKYFSDLFRLFFKTTMKQRQIREQLVQTPLPSLLLNCFFIVSAGLYLSFLLEHYAIDPIGNFWLLFLYCSAGLAVAYFIKYAGLKICGWLFNMDEAADSYIFIVFIVNKMLGIMLLPVLLILAFSQGNVYSVGLTFSWCLIGGLLVYRFILTYAAIHNQVRVNLFHFFLYLCGFEIAPLLLVYKALLIFFNQTT